MIARCSVLVVAASAIVCSAAQSGKAEASALLENSRTDLGAGRYAKAIEAGHRAAGLFHDAGDRTGEGNADTVTGIAWTYQGDYARALVDSEAALVLAREMGDRANEVTRLNNIGNIYYFEGRYTEALDRYDAAAAIVEAHAKEEWSAARRQLTIANLASLYERLGRYDKALDAYSHLRSLHAALTVPEQAQMLANMGSLYRRLGDPAKALETYRAAQALYRQRELRNGEVAVLNNIGIAEALDLGRLRDALDVFDRALNMAEATGDKPVALHSLLYRAETLFRMQRLNESGKDFARAGEIAGPLGALEEKWKALYGLARIAEARGDSKRSVGFLREAVQLIESLRRSDAVSLRGGFLADKRQVYDALIRQAAQAPEPDTADLFRLMELSHSRVAQDQRGSQTSLGEVQARLAPDTLLLEYWIGDNCLAVLWVTTQGAGVVYRTAAVRELLRKLRMELEDTASGAWRATAAGSSRELLGVAPLADRAISKLIIVPDREAALIPFEVLPSAERFSLSYLPAAALLNRDEHRRHLAPFWRRTVLALAEPATGVGPSALELQPASTTRLPAAAREAREAAAEIGGRAAIFTAGDANRKNLLSHLPERFTILHFATHAVSDQEDPERSYILLAPARPHQRSDYLFLSEVPRLDLRGLDLVTVSACDTETGKLVEGEGVSGFSRAFLEAGAQSVVTSLWQVSDEPTAALMQMFYRRLGGGEKTADALRDAKADYIRLNPGVAGQPFYWAAFVLNGDGNIRMPFVIRGVYVAAGVLAIAGIAALGWSFRRKARTVRAFGPDRLHSIP